MGTRVKGTATDRQIADLMDRAERGMYLDRQKAEEIPSYHFVHETGICVGCSSICGEVWRKGRFVYPTANV